MAAAATYHTDDPDGDEQVDGRWWLHAACRTLDTDLFFPAEPDLVPFEAQLACDRCPVRPDCLEWALRHEDYGVWAASTPEQRQRLRKTLGVRLHRPEVDRLTPAGVRTMFERGMTVAAIAAACDTSPRTVWRLLEEAGLPQTPPDDWRRRRRVKERPA